MYLRRVGVMLDEVEDGYDDEGEDEARSSWYITEKYCVRQV